MSFKASEFGEYMAKAAEHLLDCLNTAWEVNDEDSHDDLDHDEIMAAEEAVRDATRNLRSCIYEFRKRATE